MCRVSFPGVTWILDSRVCLVVRLLTRACSKAISKRITPHPTAQERPGNHHYCFVDLESVEEAEAAIAKLNGKSVPSGTLRVQLAKRPAALAPGRTGTWRGRAKPEEGRGQNGEAAAAPTETTAEA